MTTYFLLLLSSQQAMNPESNVDMEDSSKAQLLLCHAYHVSSKEAKPSKHVTDSCPRIQQPASMDGGSFGRAK